MLCKKHYEQQRKYGVTAPTRFDYDRYFVNEDYIELVLINDKVQEVARTLIDNEDLEKINKYKWQLTTYGAAIYVFHADKEAVNFRNSFQDAGLFYHETCTWVKNSLVLTHSDYQYATETISYRWKETAPHKYYGGRAQSTK